MANCYAAFNGTGRLKMKHIKRALRLYRTFVVQHLKNLMEYKIDFLTGAVSFLFNQVINIMFLSIIFSQIPNLVGWSYEEIIFIYGFSHLHISHNP